MTAVLTIKITAIKLTPNQLAQLHRIAHENRAEFTGSIPERVLQNRGYIRTFVNGEDWYAVLTEQGKVYLRDKHET